MHFPKVSTCDGMSAIESIFAIIPSCSGCKIRANYPLTGWGTHGFKGKIENECFVVICSRCRHNLKFGDFTLMFCGERQRNARKFMLHVQYDYFSFLTNQILAF